MDGMLLEGYRALRESAAWLDLSGRGKIVVRGEDRTRLLHAMTTNDVQELEPGRGCYAFFLDAQGHILGDVNLFCLPDHFLLDTEPETAGRLYAHLDKYIIADDVTLENAGSELATLAVEGPKAGDVLTALGASAPEAPYGHLPWGARTVARVNSTGAPGFFVFVRVEEKEELVRNLQSAGADFADSEAARVVRLEHGKPRYGDDFTENQLPQETQLLHGVHFNKGCYLGQEIVERVRSRGHVNRLLVRIEIDGDEPLAASTKLTAEGKDVGFVTSSAWSPALKKVVALAHLRAEHSGPGATVTAGERTVRVLPSQPAPV